MGATRKFRNRFRNRTRGSQQFKLARQYVQQQINVAFSAGQQPGGDAHNYALFRCHPQFGWCAEVLLTVGYRIYWPPVGSYSRVGYLVRL